MWLTSDLVLSIRVFELCLEIETFLRETPIPLNRHFSNEKFIGAFSYLKMFSSLNQPILQMMGKSVNIIHERDKIHSFQTKLDL